MTQKMTLQKQPRFSVAIQSDAYKNLINNTLQDEKRAARFIASVSSAVATNPALQDCDAGSILSGALLGESLDLSPSPQLGHYYLVPYNDKSRGKVAQFQLGYKAYLQLAIRSGQYKKINVLDVKEGELLNWNPLEEDIEIELIEDERKREKAKTIGYYAMFELTNGFRKAIYWSYDKMEAHAKKYSKAWGTQYSFWTVNFDGMAFKTMIRQLISKWGIMSIDMRSAYESDMASLSTDGTKSYVDNDSSDIDLLSPSDDIPSEQQSLSDKLEVI